MTRLIQRACTLAAAIVLLPSAASAAGPLDGTFTGRTADGQNVTVNVTDSKLVSISSLTVSNLECESFTSAGGAKPDGTEAAAFPLDLTPRPQRSSVSTTNLSLAFGTGAHAFGESAGEAAQGDQRTDGSVVIGQTSARLEFAFEYLTQRTPANPADGPATSRRTCRGGGSVTLTRSAAGGKRRTVALKSPPRVKGAKAGLPSLAALADAGILVGGTASAPGTIKADVRLAPGSADPFRIGKGSLGSASRAVRSGRAFSLPVKIKRPLSTPKAGDVVKLVIKLTFTPSRGGKARTTSTTVTVKA